MALFTVHQCDEALHRVVSVALLSVRDHMIHMDFSSFRLVMMHWLLSMQRPLFVCASGTSFPEKSF